MTRRTGRAAGRRETARNAGRHVTGRDDEAVRRFIERFAAVLGEAGWPPMPARIFAALLVSDAGRMTAADLAGLLGVSPAAISGGVRFLIQHHLASRERQPGSRRDVYAVHDDSWMESIMSRDQILSRWAARLAEGVTALGPDTPAGRRVGRSLAFAEFMQGELRGIAERWEEHQSRLPPPHPAPDRPPPPLPPIACPAALLPLSDHSSETRRAVDSSSTRRRVSDE